MPIAFSNSGSLDSTGFVSASATYTWSHTVAPGNNGILVFAVLLWQDVAGTGSGGTVTFNGVALTAGPAVAAAQMRSELWYLLNPPVGTFTASVLVSGATDSRKFASESFFGVRGIGTTNQLGAATGATAPSLALTPGEGGGFIVDALSRFGTEVMTPNAGQTATFNVASSSTDGQMSYKGALASAATTVGWTMASGTGGYGYTAMVLLPKPDVLKGNWSNSKVRPHPFQPGAAR